MSKEQEKIHELFLVTHNALDWRLKLELGTQVNYESDVRHYNFWHGGNCYLAQFRLFTYPSLRGL